MRVIPALAPVPLVLAGCGQGASAPHPDATQAAAAPGESSAIAPTPAPVASGTAATPETGIPLALRGNWGLVSADCASPRGDNKGLLRITATTLQFYESLGKLGAIKSRGDGAITADFEFSGEGMTWNREETLVAVGTRLTRTEQGGDEPGSGGPFVYTKCPA